ncbi:ParB/RepB/Spo0J family partition protein [Methanosarcina sp.]|uniref:ParB/RepB/Spo0J family partition protein n=1 Tax=Methanosarcina sp. TaxID=2213 RepID=UPI003BB66C87
MFANISTEDIIITGENNREEFDEKELEGLAQTIEKHGILENLVVRPAPGQSGKYELIAGERRLRAAMKIGLPVVPCMIKSALSQEEFIEIMFIENVQRKSLNAVEEAKGLRRLIDKGKSQESIAKDIGKSQPYIANRLRILDAPDEIKALVISREITPKHVVSLLPYTKYPVIKDIIEELKKNLGKGERISVTGLEKIIEEQITGYGASSTVLCLDDLEHNLRKYEPFMDMVSCEGCQHIRMCKKWGTDHRYCLEKKCWEQKVQDAKHRFERKKQDKAKGLARKEKVDTSKLDWDDYKRLEMGPGKYSEQKFDVDECEGCEYRKLNTTDDEVCLNPECWNKKNKQVLKLNAQIERDEAERTWDAVDKFLDNLPENNLYDEEGMRRRRYVSLDQNVLRSIVNAFGRAAWGEASKKAFKRWTDGAAVPGQSSDEFEQLLEKIPDDELDQAVIRLAFAVIAVQGNSCYARGANFETLKKVLPAAAEYYTEAV